MSQPTENQTKVYSRLSELGISKFNQGKSIVGALTKSLIAGEPLEAVVVGRNANYTSALFALTNTRLLYIEGDRLYHSANTIAVGAIVGVSILPTPILSAVTVQTKIGDYTIQDVNNANSHDFAKAMDGVINKIAEPAEGSLTQPSKVQQSADVSTDPTPTTPEKVTLSPSELEFLDLQHVGALTTSSASGQIHSNPVYYAIQDSKLYIMTREGTHKARNMTARPQASLVVIEQSNLQYITIYALTKEIGDPALKLQTYTAIRSMIEKRPQAKLQKALYDTAKGEYTIFELAPTAITSNLSSAKSSVR